MEMTIRTKEAQFWKKKLLLTSASESGDRPSSKQKLIMNPDIAREIFAMEKELTPQEREELKTSLLTGNEFLPWPDSESGTIAYLKSILTVIVMEKHVKSLIDEKLSDDAPESTRIWMEELKKVSRIIHETLTTWFLASGVDILTGEDATHELIKAARQKIARLIEEYQKGVSAFRLYSAVRICSWLKNDPEYSELLSLEKQVLERSDAGELTSINILLNKYRDAADKNEAIISKLRAEFDTLRKKGGELSLETAALKALMGRLKERGVLSENELKGTLMAVEDYTTHVREQLQGIQMAINCNLSYVSYLLTGQKVGILVSNYIREHYGSYAAAESIYDIIKYLPGFVPVHTQEIVTGPPMHTMEEFREAAGFLTEYRTAHPDQFESQTLISVLLGLDGLTALAGRARDLRNSISAVTKTDYIKSLSADEQDELLEFWIMADVMTRIAFLIIEYVDYNHNKAMIDLVETFPADLYEMNYHVQENRVRKSLTQIFRKRLES